MIGTHVLTDIDTQGLYGGRVGNSFRRDRLLATEGATVVEGGVGGKGSGRYGGGLAGDFPLSTFLGLYTVYTPTQTVQRPTQTVHRWGVRWGDSWGDRRGEQMRRQMGRQTGGADGETDKESR